MSKNCDIKDCFNLFPSFSLARAASSAEGGNVFHTRQEVGTGAKRVGIGPKKMEQEN